MRKLLVLRHGKSERGPQFVTDVERPLAKRGVEAAQRMAQLMLDEGHVPELIVTSAAARAVGTAELVRDVLASAVETAPELTIEPLIYDGDFGDLLSVIRGLPEERGTVLLVGHNPDLELLVDALTGHDDTVLKTCSLAVLTLDGHWRETKRGAYELEALYHPRELDD